MKNIIKLKDKEFVLEELTLGVIIEMGEKWGAVQKIGKEGFSNDDLKAIVEIIFMGLSPSNPDLTEKELSYLLTPSTIMPTIFAIQQAAGAAPSGEAGAVSQ